MRLCSSGLEDAVDEDGALKQLEDQAVIVEFPPVFFSLDGQLEDHGQRGHARAASLGAAGAVTDGGERGFNGIGGAQVSPVFGREIIEGKEGILAIQKALAGLGIFGPVCVQEGLQGRDRLVLGLGHVHVVNGALGSSLDALGHLVEDVGRLVNPATLSPRGRPLLLHGGPESQCAVPGRQQGGALEATPLQILEYFLPRRLALTVAVIDRQQLLVAIGGSTDQHQNAGAVIIQPDIEATAGSGSRLHLRQFIGSMCSLSPTVAPYALA